DFITIFNRIYVNRLFPPFWHQLTLHCGWNGTGAGGPYWSAAASQQPPGNFQSSTWCCNPQFRITARKACEVLLCLQQKDPQICNGGHVPKGDRDLSYGMTVIRVRPDEIGRIWKLHPGDVAHESGLTSSRETVVALRLNAAEAFVAIPYTSQQGMEAPFVLRTFSSVPIEIEQLPAPLSLVVSGYWTGASAGGSRHNPTWGSNPQ
ncbi:unnamed protein product, partial [Ostreobium quekettii]